jgi:hypothetical protein
MIEGEWNTKVATTSRAGRLAPAEWVQAALAIVMTLLALYGLLQMPAASGTQTPTPTTMVQEAQIARAIDGSLALSCRTVRWCSKPMRRGPYSVAQAGQPGIASYL